MAHEITASDGLVLTGTRAWHGLGTIVEEAPTAAEACKIAGLAWSVQQWPLSATDGTVRACVDSHVLNVRSDNHEQLGVVGSGWEPYNNVELADFTDALGNDGSVKIESAGSIRGGKRVWFLARGESVWASDRDEVKTYLLVANGHDGSLALTVQPTTVRVVCKNTLHMALGKGKGTALKIRHSGNLVGKIEEAKRVVGAFNATRGKFVEQVDAMTRKSLNSDELKAFFTDVYQSAIEPIPTMVHTQKQKEARADAAATVYAWCRNFDRDRARTGSEANVWTALNAVTEWFDHQKPVRAANAHARAENRVYGNVWGAGAEAKNEALQIALARV